MRKVSVYALMMLISLFISFLMAGASTVGSNLSARRIENAIHVESNGAPAVEWNRTYGTTRSDQGEAYVGNSVVQTEDRGFAVVGTSDFGTGMEADQRFWLVKTDQAGNAQWNKTYGEQRETVASIVRTSDEGYAMVGDSVIGGYGNAWLVKTDSSGSMLWNKSYTETSWATAYTLIQTSDGGYVIAGCKEYYDGWLMKTDANGTMQWSRSFVEINNTQLQSVVQTNDGGYVAVGATQYPPFSGKVDAYVVKTDSDGNMTWSAEFSRTSGNDYGRSIVQTGDGGYAIAGETDHWRNADFWLIRIDASGNLLWDKTFGGTGWDGANSIVQTSEGGYILAGMTNSFGAGGNDLWLVKTDADGNMQWNETFGGAGDDGTGAVGSSIVQTSDGGYALCGYTNSFSGDGSYQVWLIKLAPPSPRTITVPDDYPTIQAAINAASDGDTVFVRNGSYSVSVVVNKTLSLTGESACGTTIDGSSGLVTVSVTANDVQISGFRLIYCGIQIDSANCTIISSNLIDKAAVGIRLYHSYNDTIVGNTISNCNLLRSSAAFRMQYSNGSIIYHNNFLHDGRPPLNIIESFNKWDDGYPSGGNYWTTYMGVPINSPDLFKGPYQNETGSDGMLDFQYYDDWQGTPIIDNFPLTKPWPWGSHDIGISSVGKGTQKTVVFVGSKVNISVYVMNYGDNSETFSVTTYANTSLINETTDLALASRDSTVLNITWNTSGFSKGNYTISAYAQPVPGEIDTDDNNSTAGYIIVSGLGDLTGGTPNSWDFVPDGTVDGSDLIVVARCFGSWPGAPPPMLWNANCDVTSDGFIDGSDLIIIARHFGEASP